MSSSFPFSRRPWHVFGLPLLSLAALSVSEPVEAIPAFARRYDLPCYFCHDGYPQLSVLGEQFKERGYRLEDDTSGLEEWLRSVPGSFRGTMRQSFVEGGDAETLGLFKLVSAGSLGSRVSYWIDESYSLDSDGFSRIGTDNAFVRVEVLDEELYVRGGRFELDLPFTQVRTPSLYAYEIYFANTGFEQDTLAGHQDGFELGGFLDDTTRWSLAVVKGRNDPAQEELASDVSGFDGNLYGRLMRRFGEERVGAYVYWGRNVLARSLDEPDAPSVIQWNDAVFRIGGDGSAYFDRYHVFGTLMYGRNSNSFADAAHPEGTDEPLSFFGGFGELDFALRDVLILSGRLDFVSRPPPGEMESVGFVTFSPGMRLWLHPRVRLSFEVRFRNQDRGTQGAFHIEVVM